MALNAARARGVTVLEGDTAVPYAVFDMPVICSGS